MTRDIPLSGFVATRNETVTAGLQQTFTAPPTGLGSEPYGVRYQIWLTVPTTDTYRLAVYADDGFILNGQGLTDTNTTTRGPTTVEAYRELTLLPNTIYNFGLTYLNYSAATTNTLQLLWRKGGGALEVVPRESIHARGRRDYYSFGGAVVAVKEGVISTAPRVLSYLHGDHLGSVSLTTNAAGQKVSEQRYAPYGEVRWRSGAGMPTDFTFTGQRASSYGTIFMSAREYLPSLGRFLSADSIVPGAGNPQALNRYAYVFNSPLRYVDPSGHDPLDQAWLDAFRAAHGRDPSDEDRQLRLYTLTRRGPISGGVDWSAADWAEFGRQGRNYWFGRLEAEMTRRSLSDFVGEIRNLARYYVSTETDSFVSAIALLYAGIPYDNRGGQVVAQGFGNGARIAVSTCPAGAITCLWLDHGSYGFGRHVTNNDREENTHHYAGHLLAGYWLGTAVNTVGAFIREIGEGLREGHGLDTADTQMAEVAGRHGAMLRGALVDIDPSRRQISPADLAALISVDLSPR